MICFLFLVVKIVQISVRVKLLLEPSGNQRFQRERSGKNRQKGKIRSSWMNDYDAANGCVYLLCLKALFCFNTCSMFFRGVDVVVLLSR